MPVEAPGSRSTESSSVVLGALLGKEADLNSIRKTYGFIRTGRNHQTLGLRKGDLFLRGSYDLTDSTQEVLRHKMSSSFKACPRLDIVTLGVRDKQINTSPCDYNVAKKPVEKMPCKHVMFRSNVQRITFPPKEGPAPCIYNPQSKPRKGITSPFKSKLPRLHIVRSTTPGPGAYKPCWKSGDHLSAQTTEDPSFSLLFRHIPKWDNLDSTQAMLSLSNKSQLNIANLWSFNAWTRGFPGVPAA
ncbi:protein STPG4 [Entelurus aequoreus]|uniref:protein STPG4 n=1 Tax=Entelurus aequoreus TaxID=161455 RepID=UPI002B1DEABB|nr:protein STPG4 [Entelurus aequoreus]